MRMINKPNVTHERLKEVLHYNPETGIFTNITNRAPNCLIGNIAGTQRPDGYIQIRIDSRPYYAHRLAFLYMTGEWPVDEVDHNDHVRDDNRWEKLNQATRAVNGKNTSMNKNNTSGIVGVDCHRGKWRARIRFKDNLKHLGVFIDKFEAICARKSAENKYGFHLNHGM